MHLPTPFVALSLIASAPAFANIDIQFDYTYDASNFFSPAARSALESAGNAFESRFTDTLSAIVSSGSNRFDPIFFNPSMPFGADIRLNSQSFGTNVIRVYVGGADLGTSTLGLGGPGGYACSGVGSFCTDAERRGQGNVTGNNAVDFAPWGGAISFDNTNTKWYFGTAPSVPAGAFDFYSVAVHELGHVLGFGTSESFDARVQGNSFVGPTAGSVPLDADLAHWAAGTLSTFDGMAQETSMDSSIAGGTRKYFTDLDYAAMNDIGWQVAAIPEAKTWAMLLFGLGLVGFMGARRSRRV